LAKRRTDPAPFRTTADQNVFGLVYLLVQERKDTHEFGFVDPTVLCYLWVDPCYFYFC
jgi:hypothetical protein